MKASAVVVDWGWVRDQILRRERIPSRDKGGSAHALIAAVDECLAIAIPLAKPKIVSRECRITSIRSGLTHLEKNIALSGRSLASHLGRADRARLFAVTIGSALETAATRSMNQGDHLHGYFLDRIGSFAVESLAESLESITRDAYERKGLSVARRVSPGYCGWPIEEQRILSRVLGFSKAGIRLNRSCMMIPKKSISGLIAIGAKGAYTKTHSSCAACDKISTCEYRRI